MTAEYYKRLAVVVVGENAEEQERKMQENMLESSSLSCFQHERKL